MAVEDTLKLDIFNGALDLIGQALRTFYDNEFGTLHAGSPSRNSCGTASESGRPVRPSNWVSRTARRG